ncbi:MAG TPA: hypothetical protein VGC41_25870, partial [Kofleriaceae bacterium]
RLQAVAFDLARVLDANGNADNAIGTRLLHLHGIAESAQHVATAATRQEVDKLFADDLKLVNARTAYARTKHGVVGVVVYAAFVNVDNVPRSGEHFRIAGTMATDVSDPRVTVDGEEHLPVTVEGHAFHGELACKTPGQHYIAIDVTDPAHPEAPPRVGFPVYCGTPPTKITTEPLPNLDVTPEQMPERLLAIVDRERVAVQLSVMHWSPLLEKATETLAQDRIERRSSELEWHVKNAGILNPFVQFSTFHATSFADAVSKLLDDSAQNQKIFDGHNTDIAITIKPEAEGMWVAVGYLPVPTIHDLPAVQAIIAKRIIAIQAKRFGPDVTVTEDPALTKLGTLFGRELAKGLTVDAVIQTFRFEYPGYSVSAEMSIDLDNYDITPIVSKLQFRSFGVGLAQAPQDGPSAGLVYIVLYYVPGLDNDPGSDFRDARVHLRH